jgi:hypothetical protein
LNSEFEVLIRRLSQAVVDQIKSEIPGTTWDRAILDVRYAENGSSWLSKLRAMTPCGDDISVELNHDIDRCLILLNSFRKSFGDEWFGLLLTIHADQRCEMKLNYDPNCSEDDSFFDA